MWEKIRIFNFFQKSWIFFSNFFSILGKKNWKFREKIENRDFLSQKSKKKFFSKNHFFRFPRWFFSPEDFFLVLPQPSEKSKIHVYFYPIRSPVERQHIFKRQQKSQVPYLKNQMDLGAPTAPERVCSLIFQKHPARVSNSSR